MENATTGMMWNEAAKCVATRQAMQLAKIVEPNTALSSTSFKQYTLLDQLVDAEMQSKPLDNAMVINEPAKPVAGSSKHPNDMDVVDSELIYLVHPPTTNNGRWALLLVGEGVRYCVYYYNIYMHSIYVSFIIFYILSKYTS